MQRVGPDIAVDELLERFPQANGFLMERGLPCMVCGEPFWGTLGDLARRKGIDDVDALVDGLNAFLGLESGADR